MSDTESNVTTSTSVSQAGGAEAIDWAEKFVDEEQDEEVEDRRLAGRYFPGIFEEKTEASKHVWEQTTFYPGMRAVKRLKARWMQEHPNVWTVTGER